MSVIKFPPPPFLVGTEFQPLNRWLLDVQSILNSAGQITATAVTQPVGDDSDNIATTAFVLQNTASSPSTSLPLIDATPAKIGTSVQYARGDHQHPTDTSRATLNSPAFTGTPTAPTAVPLTNNTQLATTAYADAAVGVETNRAQAAEALLAPLASPALTGNPTAPTQTLTDNSTNLATTAFVQGVAAGGGSNPIVRAAVLFTYNGTSVTIVKSFNVASVTRTATGAFTVNFTTALSDANYYVSALMEKDGGNNGWAAGDTGSGLSGKTTTACPVGFFSASNARFDPSAAHVLCIE